MDTESEKETEKESKSAGKRDRDRGNELSRNKTIEKRCLRAQVFGKMSMYAEGDHAVVALEGPRVVCGRGSEGLVDAHLERCGGHISFSFYFIFHTIKNSLY